MTERTPEIGIHLALGAKLSHVRWVVIRQPLWLAAIGIGIGLGPAGGAGGSNDGAEVRMRDVAYAARSLARSPVVFMSFGVRTRGDPSAVIPVVRDVVRSTDNLATIHAIHPMEEMVGYSTAWQRFYAVLQRVHRARTE